MNEERRVHVPARVDSDLYPFGSGSEVLSFVKKKEAQSSVIILYFSCNAISLFCFFYY